MCLRRGDFRNSRGTEKERWLVFKLVKEIAGKDVFRLSPHEKSNLRPSDFALLCSTTEPQRLYRTMVDFGTALKIRKKQDTHTYNP